MTRAERIAAALETDAELLMPSPHDDIYPMYLVAMNDMQLFNSAMDSARAWWRRNNRPDKKEYWKVM